MCELFWHSVHSVYSVEERVFLTTDYTECTELCDFGELVCELFWHSVHSVYSVEERVFFNHGLHGMHGVV